MTAAADRVALRGLYAVTPDCGDDDLLVAMVEAALRGGASAIQYRNKDATPATRLAQARRVAEACARHGRPLIVNDHAALALAIDEAGLHVGADDFDDDDELAAIRECLGPRRILGVSCYRSVERARSAGAAGADYVAFGSLFPSTTKPHAPPATLGLFGDARALGVPLVGIGGITRAHIPALTKAGCDAAAVIGDLFGTADVGVIEERARAFADAFAIARTDR